MVKYLNSQDSPSAQFSPKSLLLQWHLTDQCNNRCKHCYQAEVPHEELSFEQLLQVLDQFQNLLGTFRQINPGYPISGQITLTGGEPFLRRDFLDLLQIVARKEEDFAFAILTNGTMIDSCLASRLAELGPRFVQISIEGSEETHDRIRGRGDFGRATRAIKILKEKGIVTYISFTAHSENFREFPIVAKLARQLGADRLWSDRYLPLEKKAHCSFEPLNAKETHDFFQLMFKEQLKACRWFRRKGSEISMKRALQFLVAGGTPYKCSAGSSLITILANGDVVPCRRMPIVVGNVLQTPLEDIYCSNDFFKSLRDKRSTPEGCTGCRHQNDCAGGLRCLSYACAGTPFEKDPGCWMQS